MHCHWQAGRLRDSIHPRSRIDRSAGIPSGQTMCAMAGSFLQRGPASRADSGASGQGLRCCVPWRISLRATPSVAPALTAAPPVTLENWGRISLSDVVVRTFWSKAPLVLVSLSFASLSARSLRYAACRSRPSRVYSRNRTWQTRLGLTIASAASHPP